MCKRKNLKCLKCGKILKRSIEIDGVKKNSVRTKYCLDCVPFGYHNISSLEKYKIDKNSVKEKEKVCPICNTVHFAHTTKCPTCEYQIRKQKRLPSIYKLVGTKCWYCGYDKGESGIPILDFHHMFDKKFNIGSTRLAVGSIEIVLEELQKCVLLCCRCHREFHRSLIGEEVIEQIYKEKWEGIRLSSTYFFLNTKTIVGTMKYYCHECGKQITGCSGSGLCEECAKKKRRIADRPSKEELEELIKTKSFLELGRQFGVSDNAIRKWAKYYGLKYRKKDL